MFVVYVTGEKGENKKHALARLNPYQEQIAKVTSNFLTPQAPKPALCANFFPLKGGTRNPENWNDAVDFYGGVVYGSTKRYFFTKA